MTTAEAIAKCAAQGLVVMPAPSLTPPQIMRRKAYDQVMKRRGDKVSRAAQAHAMSAAGWSHERIARNLQVTVRSVQNYLRT